MKTKWILPALMALAIGVAALGVTGCNKSEHGHSDGHAHQYTCPMKEHADVLSDKPGNCPKCGMKLVEKKWPTATAKTLPWRRTRKFQPSS